MDVESVEMLSNSVLPAPQWVVVLPGGHTALHQWWPASAGSAMHHQTPLEFPGIA